MKEKSHQARVFYRVQIVIEQVPLSASIGPARGIPDRARPKIGPFLSPGTTWGAQFPIAGSMLKLIDPFYFTLLRHMAVSVILVLLLIVSEGTKALRFEGRAKWVWFYGTMAFTVYNFLLFLGQKTAGPSGAVLASIMMALMPITSVLVIWASRKTTPSNFTLGCIVAAFLGVSLVITKGEISVLSSTGGNLMPSVLILTGVFAWVIYTIGGCTFTWSPLRYTTLSCILGAASIGGTRPY